MGIFVKYCRYTGVAGNISDLDKKFIEGYCAFKHVTPHTVGSSLASGILESGEKMFVIVCPCQYFVVPLNVNM